MPSSDRVRRIEAATETLFVEILAALAHIDGDDRVFPRKLLEEIADADTGQRAAWLELAERGLSVAQLRRITRESIGAVARGEVAEMYDPG